MTLLGAGETCELYAEALAQLEAAVEANRNEGEGEDDTDRVIWLARAAANRASPSGICTIDCTTANDCAGMLCFFDDAFTVDEARDQRVATACRQAVKC